MNKVNVELFHLMRINMSDSVHLVTYVSIPCVIDIFLEPFFDLYKFQIPEIT